MSRSGTYDPKYGFFPDDDCPEPQKPLTNADRIRAMTDEELAELISSDWCEIICSPNTNCQYEDCRGKILGWLKQEAAEGE